MLVACAPSVGNKIFQKIIINKNNKYKEHFEKNQQTITPFEKFYTKSLQENLIGKNELKSLCKTFIKYLGEKKNESFL